MVDIVTPEVRSRMMASIRSRDTKPELKVRRYLHGLGFRYRLSPRHVPGKPDLVFPRYQAAIFVHGCFWHGHAGCRFATVPGTRRTFWTEKLAGNRKRDAAVKAQLRDLGWRVAVVWECALKLDSEHALQHVADFVAGDQKEIDIAA